jgi:probable O-glycosylation ligase (exosortase A-associated)
MLVAMTALGIALVAFMPQSWEDRMQSILAYKEDRSAMSRISTWKMLFDLALDRPIVGGGFEPYSLATLAKYSPDSAKVHSAHSIYFQVLGEHGFVGFALFCVFWLLTWRLAARIIRRCKGIEDLKWAESLAKMAQVSLVGYFAGGLFLNLAYWDAPYYLFVALAVAWHAMLPPPGTAGGRLSTSPPRQLPAGNQLGVARNAPASRSGSRPGGRNSMTG